MKTKIQFCYSIISSLIVLFLYLAITVSNNDSYSVIKQNGSDIKSSEQGDFQVYKLLVGHKAYPLKYTIQGGQLKNLSIIDADRINVTIDAISSGQIVLQIPKNLISRQISSFSFSFDKISNKETDFPDLRTFTFDFEKGKQSLEIEGIIHVPDFLSKSIPEKNSDENKLDVIPISSTLNRDNLSNWTPEDIPKIMWLEIQVSLIIICL